jgi:serine phosphatase RsbU (regulator of sigma subunit)
MNRKDLIITLLFALSSFLLNAGGQDTLLVRSELKMKRSADSALAAEFLRTALRFESADQDDSAGIYIARSLEIAANGNFLALEASGYEYSASIDNRHSDWESTLRNYLRASSVYSKMGDKENEARIFRKIAGEYFSRGIFRKASEYSEKEFLLYGENDARMLASAAEMAGKSYYYLPADSLSLKWYDIAASFYELNADSSGSLRCSGIVASLSVKLERYDQANVKYKQILSKYLLRNDYANVASTYNQTGFLKFRKNDLKAALDDFSLAVGFSEKGGKDYRFLTDVWSNIAICHQNMGNQKEMLESFENALKYAKESGRTGEVARIERIMSAIYFMKGDNYHAELYCLSCIESAKSSGNLDVLQLCYKDYSEVLEKGNDFIKALEYYEKHLNLRDSLNFENRLAEKDASDRQAEYESLEQRLKTEIANEEIEGLELKNIKAESSRRANEITLLLKQQELDRSENVRLAQSVALEKERLEINNRIRDIKSLKQQQAIDSLSLEQKDMEAKALESENQLLETRRREQELKAEKEKQIRKLAVGLGVLMVLVAVMILAGLISTRKQNQRLAESKRQIERINADLEATNKEVLKQKDIIEQKNQAITDSIQYASRIQTAVLPPVNFLGEWKIENFILFKPKAIVSGDFYWGVKKNGKIIVAAGDCTGHGVPGGFMSMLGHAFLDEIVNTRKIENAATILNYLRDEIIYTLKQKGTTGEARDGMDISLVIMDLQAGILDFAGANNPIYLIRDNKIQKYQADHMPIGIHFISFTPFRNNRIEMKKGDYLYLFSDGYADQFGGPKGRKFMYKPFQELLLQNHNKPMEVQKDILDSTFQDWKGNYDQVDDVLVIGMHI